jgi:hypothetical protein
MPNPNEKLVTNLHVSAAQGQELCTDRWRKTSSQPRRYRKADWLGW